MTPVITITLSPNANKMIAKLQDKSLLGRHVANAMDKENEDVVKDIKQRISGPAVGREASGRGATLVRNRPGSGERFTVLHKGQTLKHAGEYVGSNSGHLRKSIGRTYAKWDTNPDALEVTSKVGSGAAFVDEHGKRCEACEYAAIHEFGKKVHHARAIGSVHLRTDRSGALLRNARGGAIFASRGHKLFQNVPYQSDKKQGYDVTIPERSYVRKTLADHAAFYGKAISAAVVRYWKEVKG